MKDDTIALDHPFHQLDKMLTVAIRMKQRAAT
jgi:hypothetical protein